MSTSLRYDESVIVHNLHVSLQTRSSAERQQNPEADPGKSRGKHMYDFSYLCKTELENGISHLISETA